MIHYNKFNISAANQNKTFSLKKKKDTWKYKSIGNKKNIPILLKLLSNQTFYDLNS